MGRRLVLFSIGLVSLAPPASFGLEALAFRGVECVAFGATMEMANKHYKKPEDPVIVERDRKMWADLTAATRGTASDEELATETARLVKEMTPGIYASHLNLPFVPGTSQKPSDFIIAHYDRCEVLMDELGVGRP